MKNSLSEDLERADSKEKRYRCVKAFCYATPISFPMKKCLLIFSKRLSCGFKNQGIPLSVC